MRIKIPVAAPTLGEEEAEAVADAVRSGRVSSGSRVRAFEEDFSRYVGARHAIAVNTGTAALHVALAALGVGPGDEVILPSLTFISTANVVLYQGATPVLCECDPRDYNVTPQAIEGRISGRTRAVIPVEMNGLPLDYDNILPVAEAAGVPVVVDSAESLGSAYQGRLVGSQGLIHCFSFYPNKTITTGEGGMITTSDDALAARIRMLVNQGQEGRYNHVALGFNYRMTEMQGALGTVQMKRLERNLKAKECIASRYDRAFKTVRGVGLPARPQYATAQSWFMYSVRVKDRDVRDRVASLLAAEGIETRVGFPPIHTQPYYHQNFGFRDGDLPVTLDAWSRKLDIPSWPELPEEQQAEVVEALVTALGKVQS